jgi:hypothetical protein
MLAVPAPADHPVVLTSNDGFDIRLCNAAGAVDSSDQPVVADPLSTVVVVEPVTEGASIVTGLTVRGNGRAWILSVT